MKVQRIHSKLLIGFLSVSMLMSACSLKNDSGAVSAETDEEAMISAGVESMIDTAASSSAPGFNDSSSSAAVSSLAIASGSAPNRCKDSSALTQNFSCDDDTGIGSREVTGEDCELINYDVTYNGSYTNDLENMGVGSCDTLLTKFVWHNLVFGRNGLDAAHTHTIDDANPKVFSWVNARGFDVNLTITGSREIKFSNAVVDTENNTTSFDATVDKLFNRERVVTKSDGSQTTVHKVTVYTQDGTVSVLDDEDQEELIDTFKPKHQVTIDNDTDDVTDRFVAAGEGTILVKHRLANLLTVIYPGEDGLDFGDGRACGIQNGTIKFDIYEGLDLDNDEFGHKVGNGSVTWENGVIVQKEINGDTSFNPKFRSPCD